MLTNGFVCVKTSIQPLLLCKMTTTGQGKATLGFDCAHLHVGTHGKKRLFCFNIRILKV